MTDNEKRQQKIIVALFLILGKALNQLGARERNAISVTEDEIRVAWTEQKSPVRLISEKPAVYSTMGSADTWNPEQRVFKVVLGELELKKTGINLTGKMPSEPVAHPQKTRVFDLE